MNLIEITKGYELKQNEQTEQMKSLPDITDKWKQLAKEQAASLELVTETILTFMPPFLAIGFCLNVHMPLTIGLEEVISPNPDA